MEMVNEAVRAAEAGDPARAARIGAEAVGKLRERERRGSDSGAAESVLIKALGNQSEYLSRLDRHDEALAAAEEAAGLVWADAARGARLDAARGTRLVIALTTLANRLVEAGRAEAALDPAKEALAIVEVRPAPEVARLLATLAVALGRAGKPDEAVVVSERALGMWRALAAQEAGGGKPGGGRAARPPGGEAAASLGLALSSHAARLYELGRWADAVEFSAESVDHHRRHREEPDRLGRTLTHHARLLAEVGRQEEALAAAAEVRELEKAEARKREGPASAGAETGPG